MEILALFARRDDQARMTGTSLPQAAANLWLAHQVNRRRVEHAKIVSSRWRLFCRRGGACVCGVFVNYRIEPGGQVRSDHACRKSVRRQPGTQRWRQALFVDLAPDHLVQFGVGVVEADRAFLQRDTVVGQHCRTQRRLTDGTRLATSSQQRQQANGPPQRAGGTVRLPVAYESRWEEMESKNDRESRGRE